MFRFICVSMIFMMFIFGMAELGVVPNCYKTCETNFYQCLSLSDSVNILDCLKKRGVCYLQKCL